MEVSVSILSAKDRIAAIKRLNRTSINYFHIDVMDGNFVNNFQFPLKEIKDVSQYIKKPLDIHLMVENPEIYIDAIKEANLQPEYITFHSEIHQDIKSLTKKIKQYGYKVGIAINPNTNIKEIKSLLPYIDLILVMSVEPGHGGQKFIQTSLEKIANLKELINTKNYQIKIEVDGGVNNDNTKDLKIVGTDIIVCGSYIVNAKNYQNQINSLKI